jgi:hypothetical protein
VGLREETVRRAPDAVDVNLVSGIELVERWL